MAIVVQSSASANVATTTSTTITKPSGVVSGDYLFAAIGFEQSGGNTVNSVPSDWTEIESLIENNTALYTYFKVAGGSEPSDYTWGLTGSQAVGGSILRIDGQSVDAGGAFEVELDDHVGNTDAPSFPTGITPTFASSLILIASCSKSNGTIAHSAHAITTSNPSWTAVQGTSAGGTTISIAYAVRPEVTSTGAWSLTAGNTGTTDTTSIILTISPRTDVTISPTVITATTSVQAPTVSAGATVSPAVVTSTVAIQAPTVAVTDSKWTNKPKSSSTWANKPKS